MQIGMVKVKMYRSIVFPLAKLINGSIEKDIIIMHFLCKNSQLDLFLYVMDMINYIPWYFEGYNIIIISCQIWNRHWRPCLSKHLCHQTTSKNLNIIKDLKSEKTISQTILFKFLRCSLLTCRQFGTSLFNLKIKEMSHT